MTCISIWSLQSTLMALNIGCGTICKFRVYSCPEAQLHSCGVIFKKCVAETQCLLSVSWLLHLAPHAADGCVSRVPAGSFPLHMSVPRVAPKLPGCTMPSETHSFMFIGDKPSLLQAVLLANHARHATLQRGCGLESRLPRSAAARQHRIASHRGRATRDPGAHEVDQPNTFCCLSQHA